MKKVLVCFIAIAIVFCFFSCKTSEPAAKQEAQAEKPAPAKAPAPAPAPTAKPAEKAPEKAPAPAPAKATAPTEAPATTPEQPKALSEFPAGKWLDANWDALWVFFADGSVKLYDSRNGDLIYDFNGKTKNLKLEPAGTGLKLSFRCDETQRFYIFEKALEGTDMELDIDRDWTDEEYHVLMPLQE
jgi:hypothetical protein